MPRHEVAVLTICCAIAVLSPVLQAQINTGKISGTITDTSGAGVPDVALAAVNEETGVITRTQSHSSGDYLVNFLLPGRYRVEAEKAGFQKAAETGVVVSAGGIAHIEIAMRIGELRQTVEVAANQIAVTTETSELSQTFTYKTLDALPNIDRNPLYQMNLMPGANNDRGSGNYGNNGGENGSSVGNCATNSPPLAA